MAPLIQARLNRQAPSTSVGQCTPSQIRDQPTIPAYTAAPAQIARRRQPARTRPIRIHAHETAKIAAAVVCPEGNEGPPAAPAQRVDLGLHGNAGAGYCHEKQS
jgi:hypothetical protein